CARDNYSGSAYSTGGSRRFDVW
nr:immunoglobulin heavy chain junction region [Macaca mulatta]